MKPICPHCGGKHALADCEKRWKEFNAWWNGAPKTDELERMRREHYDERAGTR